VLHRDEVGPDERDVVVLTECPDDAGVVDARYQNREKVRKQSRLLLEVEGDRLVVASSRFRTGCSHPHRRKTHISMFATRTTTSLNWLCSHASAERSIIASAALS
jgi:hypothetical protein